MFNSLKIYDWRYILNYCDCIRNIGTYLQIIVISLFMIRIFIVTENK